MKTKIAIAVALAAWAAAPVAPAAGRDRCAVGGSRTLGSSEGIRVYSKGVRVYICRRATGRRSRFDNPPNRVRVDDVVGWRVAYVDHDPQFNSRGSEHDFIRVYDARRRKIIVDESAFSTAINGTVTGEVGRLSLVHGGGVAWIARNTSLPDRPVEVQIARPGQGADVLDTSPAIELDSLAVNRRYVYWSREGVAQRAAHGG